MSSVVVPIRVAAVVVAATPYVVEVVAQQRAEHPGDIGMIEESTQMLAFVNERGQ